MPKLASLGDKLVAARQARGLSRAQAARHMGLTPQGLRLIENDERRPSYDTLVRVFELYRGHLRPDCVFGAGD